MNRTLLKVIFSNLVRVATLPIRVLPIKKNRILFTGLTGGSGYDYSCNPKYVYEYLRDTYKGQFEFIWAVSNKEKYAFLKEEGVKLVKHFTVSSFPMLLTSNVIVTNGSYVPWFPFRKKQYVINTWHGGGAYKKVENEIEKEDWATKQQIKFCADNMRLFVASCKVQEEQMIRDTYQYQGEVLHAGTPRNDNLIKGNITGMAKKVRAHYEIPEYAGVVLYAPTYRQAEPAVVLNSDRILEALEEDGREWFFLCRYHRYQEREMNVSVTGKRMIPVMDYPDMQELLAAADIMITDYSSCVWDYAFLKRPCFLYIPDRESYTKRTGFYVGLENWPFPVSENMDELIEKIRLIQGNYNLRDRLLKEMERHIQQLGSYETGNSTKEIADIILEKIEE